LFFPASLGSFIIRASKRRLILLGKAMLQRLDVKLVFAVSVRWSD
jgi:hypothetical protein